MTIVTRFAPSPTGYLHIGGARTALFNFLYARHFGGKFLLRIEDTDKERSTVEACDAILEGLKWLDLYYDGEPVFQSKNILNHQQAAEELVKLGQAYYCLSTPEEIQALREKSLQKGENFIFHSPWRDKNLLKQPGAAIRLKAQREGFTEINDLVQGKVKVSNETLDDMVLLRSDGTPTYMLAVVVDDQDMGVTHVIRGDDHLNNAFRQIQIYKAFKWELPQYAHIPLIHSEDGAKLSKRHGAMGIDFYEKSGYLPEAINNYLLRLGWSHGNDEIISRDEAISWFDIKDANKGPARINFDKLMNVNSHYIKHSTDAELLSLIKEQDPIASKTIPYIKNRAKTLVELRELINLFTTEQTELTQETKDLLENTDIEPLRKVFELLETIQDWGQDLKTILNTFLKENNIKLGDLGPILRLILIGTSSALGVFDIMLILGKTEVLKRLQRAL